MFKNIFLMFTLFLFTIVSLILINLIITFGGMGGLGIGLGYFLLFFILPIFLTFYLIYILIKSIYKNELSIIYGYVFLGFIIGIFVFYFIFYTSTREYDFIPESNFEANLQNLELKDENNGLLALDDFVKSNSQFVVEISNIEKHSWKLYYCITENKYCNDFDKDKILDKYLIFINENIDKIDELNSMVNLLNEYEYFKHNIEKNEFVSMQGLLSLTRFSLLQSMYYLEKGNSEKALKILNSYSKLGDKLLLGDTTLIGMIVGITIKSQTLNNYSYVINNYDLEKNTIEFMYLISDLEKKYNAKEIFGNEVKLEYQINKYGLNKLINSSMILNKEELFNIQRNGWQRVIDKKEDIYYDYKPNIFTREYLYYKLFGKYHSFSLYIEDIEKLNTKKIEVNNLLK